MCPTIYQQSVTNWTSQLSDLRYRPVLSALILNVDKNSYYFYNLHKGGYVFTSVCPSVCEIYVHTTNQFQYPNHSL